MWLIERKRSGVTFLELLWILRSFLKVALGSIWITKRWFVKLMLPRAMAKKKNGRSCRVWIFCVSCVHEDALCTLMIYHGGLMCHQLYHGTFLAENESKSALILNIHSNMHSVHSKFARIYFQIILGKRYLNLSKKKKKMNFDIYKAG